MEYAAQNLFSEYPDIVLLPEMCQMLRCGRNKAYSLLRSKEIKSRRVGKDYRIPKAEIIKYISKIE